MPIMALNNNNNLTFIIISMTTNSDINNYNDNDKTSH